MAPYTPRSPSEPAPHDNYGGTANCAQCKGRCTLTGDAAALTAVVRAYFETEAVSGNGWMSPAMRSALERIGVDINEHRRRALCATAR